MSGPLTSTIRPAALLLTGGASRRMGRDKATLVVAGVPLAARTAALLFQVAAPVLEVGPGYTTLPCVQEQPRGAGPLAAIAAGGAALGDKREALGDKRAALGDKRAALGDKRAALAGKKTPVLVVATDLPRLTVAFLRCLIEHPVPTPDHSVVPIDAGGRAQPVCARYSPAALALAGELVAAGHRSMHDLLARVPVIFLAVDADNSDALLDIDTPDDLDDLNEATHP